MVKKTAKVSDSKSLAKVDGSVLAVKPKTQILMSEDLGIDKDEAILLLGCILQSFAFNVQSPDVLILSLLSGKGKAIEAGLDPEKAEKANKNLLKYMDKVRKTNIISRMF